jgi:PKD repeat protein
MIRYIDYFRYLALPIACLIICLQLSACGGGSSEQPEQAEQQRQSPAAFMLEQQALLESMPIPDGMDETDWQELKTAARSMLDSVKATLAAPITIPSGAKLTLSDDTLELAWGYACQGDYDQNSEVNIADLAPLGSNFGASSGGGPFPAGSLLSMVDGDANGEINISDISPIGTNFGRRVGSYNVYRSLSFSDVPSTNGGPNGPGAELLGSVPYASAVGNRAQEQLQFSFTLDNAVPGWFYFVRPADGTSEGTPSNVVSFGAKDGNLDPVASLLADPTSGDAPLTVNFDASGSSDPDGLNGDISDIVQFLWDFDGDGLADESTSTPLVTHIYNQPGSFNASVGVFDAAAGLGSTSVAISVGQAGNLPPVAVIDGSPTSGQAPLTVDFNATSSSDDSVFDLTFEWDFDGDGVFDLNSGIDLLAANTYTAGGVFNAVLRVTDIGGLSDTSEMTISVEPPAANQLPTAVLQASPLTGNFPHTVTFNFDDSSDPDGSIVLFELDFEGDGNFDLSSSVPLGDIEHEYPLGGNFNATLRVTDNRGGTATDSITVTVTDGSGNAPPFAIFDRSPTFGDIPLTVDFDAANSSDPDGTIIKYEWDFENDGSIDEFSILPTIQHTYLTAGNFFPRLTVTDNLGATSTFLFPAPIEVRNPDNLPPVAFMQVLALSGSFPEEFEFDGSGSSDPDGTVINYEWDFDGDGSFDLDSGSTAIVTHKVHQNGSFTPRLRVTDNEFDTSTGEGLSYDVSTGWQTVDVASLAFQAGDIDSLSFKLGFPVLNRLYVAFNEGTNSKAKVTHSSDGLSWSTPSPVSTEVSELGLALVNISNKPGLFYSRKGGEGGGGLSYVLASNQDANIWSSPLSVSSGGPFEVGLLNALKVQGNPAASFLSGLGGLFPGRFARAADGTGTDFLPVIDSVVYPDTNLGEAFALIGGNPAIALQSGTQVLFSRASTADGSSWPASMTLVDELNAITSFVNSVGLLIIDGNPALAYADRGVGLKFVRAQDANGDNWGTPLVVAGTESMTIRHLSLLSISGMPAIVFQADVAFNDNLVFVQALDADGTSWGELEFVDTLGLTGNQACVSKLGSKVVINYWTDGTPRILRAAVR